METPLGPLRVVATSKGLAHVGFVDQKYAPAQDAFPEADTEILATAVAQLTEYFSGTRTRFELPLDLAGTAFQKRVWGALANIPAGQTRSYGQLAAELGSVARAVGTANGRNPISVILPCHRVIGADGALTGYAGGLDRKRWLLRHEGSAIGAQGSLFGAEGAS